MRTRLAAGLAALGFPLVAFGATSYRFHTVLDGSVPAEISGQVLVEGSRARRDYDNPPAYLVRARQVKVVGEGRAEIEREGESQLLVLDTKESLYYREPRLNISDLGSLRFPIALSGPDVSVGEVKVSVETGSVEEKLGPYSVRKVVLKAGYSLSRPVQGRTIRATVAATAEFWIAPELKSHRFAFGDGAVGLRTGWDEVDAAVSARLSDIGGPSVKTVLSATRKLDAGGTVTESATRTISEVEETPAVAAERFAVPSGFRFERPVVAPPTRLTTPSPPARITPPIPPVFAPQRASAAASPVAQGLSEAERLMRQKKYDEAIHKLEAVNKASGGECGECLLGLAQAYNAQRAFKDAAATARRLIELAPDDRLRALGHNELGAALFLAGRKDAENLAAAEAAFRKVTELQSEKQDGAHLSLAAVLYRQGRDAEAQALLNGLLERGTAADAMAERARQMLRNPRCAEAPCPSGVAFLTSDGSRVTLDELRGRAVVISFWATWCRPCIEAVPDLKRLKKRFDKEPFALVGINVDVDRETMEHYLSQEKIEWPQRWDEHHRISRELFNVDRYPTEIILDHEGVIVDRSYGWSSATFQTLTRRVHDAVSQAKKAQRKPGA